MDNTFDLTDVTGEAVYLWNPDGTAVRNERGERFLEVPVVVTGIGPCHLRVSAEVVGALYAAVCEE
jgi:hypothetical protein